MHDHRLAPVGASAQFGRVFWGAVKNEIGARVKMGEHDNGFAAATFAQPRLFAYVAYD